MRPRNVLAVVAASCLFSASAFAFGTGCADPKIPYGKITVADALYALRASVGTSLCDRCVCDTDASGGVGADDALRILKLAVGHQIDVECAQPCRRPPP